MFTGKSPDELMLKGEALGEDDNVNKMTSSSGSLTVTVTMYISVVSLSEILYVCGRFKMAGASFTSVTSMISSSGPRVRPPIENVK